jgi:hypothetical protein
MAQTIPTSCSPTGLTITDWAVLHLFQKQLHFNKLLANRYMRTLRASHNIRETYLNLNSRPSGYGILLLFWGNLLELCFYKFY